jgi:hypothetical protein
MLALVFHPRAEKNLLVIPKKTRLLILDIRNRQDGY